MQSKMNPSRPVVAAALTAILAAPFAAALTALLWKWPVFMVGLVGGTPRAAFGAAFTSIVYMAIGGVVVLLGLGGGAGHLLRNRPTGLSVAAGFTVAVCAAVAVPVVADRLQVGPGWIYVHVGGFDEHQATLGGNVRIVDAPAVGVEVTVRGDDNSSSTTTGSQGWAMLRVPRGEYSVVTRCGRQDVDVSPGDHLAVTFYCE